MESVTTDKEHVNVVFIGHVGKMIFFDQVLEISFSVSRCWEVDHWRADDVLDRHGGQEDIGEI